MTRQFWANLALCVILGSLAILAVTRISSALTPKGLLVSEPKPSAEAAPLLHQVLLEKYRVGENQDHVIAAEFQIRNDSGHDVKNFAVVCDFYDNSGEFKDRKWWTLDETIPAGQTATLSSTMRRFVNSQARALNCQLTDFQLVKQPFYALNRATEGGHAGSSDSGHTSAEPASH